MFEGSPNGPLLGLHWTQEAHRHLLVQAGLGESLAHEWLDRAPAPPESSTVCSRVVYVDNQIFIGSSAAVVERDRKKA